MPQLLLGRIEGLHHKAPLLNLHRQAVPHQKEIVQVAIWIVTPGSARFQQPYIQLDAVYASCTILPPGRYFAVTLIAVCQAACWEA